MVTFAFCAPDWTPALPLAKAPQPRLMDLAALRFLGCWVCRWVCRSSMPLQREIRVKINRGLIKVSKMAETCPTISDHVMTSAPVFRQEFAPLLLSLWSLGSIFPGMLLPVPFTEICTRPGNQDHLRCWQHAGGKTCSNPSARQWDQQRTRYST